MGTEDETLVDELHAHLAATAELPVDRAASRWLGEAQAVAADARDAPEDAVDRRVEQARELLSHVGTTGSSEADEHVEDARALIERIL